MARGSAEIADFVARLPYNPIMCDRVMGMENSTLEITETVNERDLRVGGVWEVTYRRTVEVRTRDYGYKCGPKRYQTERWYRNGQLTNSAQYPADTEYAAARRVGMVPAVAA